jgi:hypothetical protein
LIENLLQSLISHETAVPANCAEWKNIDDLNEKLEAALAV